MRNDHAGCVSYLVSCHAPSGGGVYHRAAITIQAVWRYHRFKVRGFHSMESRDKNIFIISASTSYHPSVVSNGDPALRAEVVGPGQGHSGETCTLSSAAQGRPEHPAMLETVREGEETLRSHVL